MWDTYMFRSVALKKVGGLLKFYKRGFWGILHDFRRVLHSSNLMSEDNEQESHCISITTHWAESDNQSGRGREGGGQTL